MTPLYTQSQFDSSQTRDLLPLQCEGCGNPYHWSKKRIKEALSKGGRWGSFCSPVCYQAHRPAANQATCQECGKPFSRCKSELAKSKRAFCSAHCSATFYNRERYGALWASRPIPAPKQPKPKNQCKSCGQETTNVSYCNGTCRNRALNPLINGSRSKAEKTLVPALKAAYPLWTIEENNRTILNGLELDVYIPEIKLAIEWNGVFHYEPIHGKGHLERITQKDGRKIELCKELGIELIVICDRTSHDSFIRETVTTLIEKLKPLYQMAGQ